MFRCAARFAESLRPSGNFCTDFELFPNCFGQYPYLCGDWIRTCVGTGSYADQVSQGLSLFWALKLDLLRVRKKTTMD
jgi:hypothetical protein